MPVTHLNSLISDVGKIYNLDSLEHITTLCRIYDAQSTTQQENIDPLYSVRNTTFQELHCRKVIHFVPHKDKNNSVKDDDHVGGDIVIAYILNTTTVNNGNVPKVNNDENIVKYCSYDIVSIVKQCEQLGLDYEVKRLEKHSSMTRYLIGIYVNSVKDNCSSEEKHVGMILKDKDNCYKIARNFDNVEDICSVYSNFLRNNEEFFNRLNKDKYYYIFSTDKINIYSHHDVEKRVLFCQGTNKESSLIISYSITLGNFRDTDANNLIIKYFKGKVNDTCLQCIDAGLLFRNSRQNIEIEDLNQYVLNTIYIA